MFPPKAPQQNVQMAKCPHCGYNVPIPPDNETAEVSAPKPPQSAKAKAIAIAGKKISAYEAMGAQPKKV